MITTIDRETKNFSVRFSLLH